jgi:hypothetical protein
MSFNGSLTLERRVSHDCFVAVGCNYYSVPDRTRRVVEVQQLPDLFRIGDHVPPRSLAIYQAIGAQLATIQTVSGRPSKGLRP